MNKNSHNASDALLEAILRETKDEATIQWEDSGLGRDLLDFQKSAASEPLNKGKKAVADFDDLTAELNMRDTVREKKTPKKTPVNLSQLSEELSAGSGASAGAAPDLDALTETLGKERKADKSDLNLDTLTKSLSEETSAVTMAGELPRKTESDCHNYAVDIAAAVLMALLVFAEFTPPLNILFLLKPAFNFACCGLFTLFGFVYLREEAELKRELLRVAKITGILLLVYSILAIIHTGYYYNQPFGYVTKRWIFNFLVLNTWGPGIGGSISYIVSLLFALVICYFCWALRKFSWVAMLLLFALAFVTGEGAVTVFKFDFFGNNFIPGNFLTRTLPYLLLGAVLFRLKDRLKTFPRWAAILMLVAGAALSYGEVLVLSSRNTQYYSGQLLSYIPMSMAVCLIAMNAKFAEEKSGFAMLCQKATPWLYYVYDPAAMLYALICSIIINSQTAYSVAICFIAPLLPVLVFLAVALAERVCAGLRKEFSLGDGTDS